MPLNGEQQKAYDNIMKWLYNGDSGDWLFTLHGFAGTGKTFLLQYLIRNLDSEPFCCAPTGKAASVLNAKIPEVTVTTVHKLLYSPHSSESKQYINLKRKLKKEPDNEKLKEEVENLRKALTDEKVGFSSLGVLLVGEFIIVDEGSMISNNMKQDLHATGAKVLIVGDGGQLPAVGDDGWFINDEPNFRLVEVQRQALDSPIIRLSMDVRKESLNKSNYMFDDCKIIHKTKLSHDDWLNSDQIITGRNATRQKLNKWFRRKLGYQSKLPMAGEKLICLKNSLKKPFINGVIFSCTEDAFINDHETGMIGINYDDVDYYREPFYPYHCLSTYNKNEKEEPYFLRRHLLELDWGYAITVHKSQGSEWNNVLIADDEMQLRNRDFRKRWLYTAITRAKENLIWMEN